ncbi:Carboxylesterase NlhH [Symmachiella dynata]|uniref:Carboxylesterase NlhH n=1 Tax=Symmachiella dynata TaxID=2527995 RepID=A0A517ZST2_9PLAN|nr:alpha/beta hydrolase [Symmachiella dynata]QDU45551.1 Carboxylesterase NlhH [Symmachiella dynata]
MPRQNLLIYMLGTAVCLAMTCMTHTVHAEEPAEIEYHEDVIYGVGGDEQLKLDWARPKKFDKPLTAIIYIHGGGWTFGNKNGHRDEIQKAAREGYFSATIGYRLAPAHRFPAQIEDCKCAIRFLRANADQLGLDREKIGAIGFSAGAHLVMMLATMDDEDGLEGKGGWFGWSSKIQAGVSFFGPTNLQSEFPESSNKLVVQFLNGTAAQQPEAYRLASPITYVNAGDPPLLLYQGTKDTLVPHDQALQMVEALTAVEVPGRVEFLIGQGHGWRGPEAERTFQAAIDFIAEQTNKTE